MVNLAGDIGVRREPSARRLMEGEIVEAHRVCRYRRATSGIDQDAAYEREP